MRLLIDGKNLTRVRPKHIKECLRQMNKSTRYRRHIHSLTFRLSCGQYSPVKIPNEIFFKMLTLFRRLEVFWEHGQKQENKKRKVFPSYQYIYWQLCNLLGCPHLTGDEYLLKDRRLMRSMHMMYSKLAELAGIECIPFARISSV